MDRPHFAVPRGPAMRKFFPVAVFLFLAAVALAG
jgi:hypothetical protein